jgi:hypothetical protein
MCRTPEELAAPVDEAGALSFRVPTPVSDGSDEPPPPPAGPPPPTPPPPAGPPPPTPPGSSSRRSKLPRANKAAVEVKDENRNPQRKKRAALEPEPAALRASGRRNR